VTKVFSFEEIISQTSGRDLVAYDNM